MKVERICIYPHQESDELLELAWGLIANAYGGDWDKASEASGWKPAAVRWRDRWHQSRPGPEPVCEACDGRGYNVPEIP